MKAQYSATLSHEKPAMRLEERPPMVQAYTGKLMRGAQVGEVRGWLFDHKSGHRIEFNGVRDPRPGKGYLLIGKVVPV